MAFSFSCLPRCRVSRTREWATESSSRPGFRSPRPHFLILSQPLLTDHVLPARPVGTEAERDAWWWGGGPYFEGVPYPPGPAARFGDQGGYANVQAFAALPRQDYAAVDVALRASQPMHYAEGNLTNLPEWPPAPALGKPPIGWRRQVLFLKDDDPGKTAYLLIRDTVKGGQPTMWQMWTVSETLDTPARLQDVAAALTNKPGDGAYFVAFYPRKRAWPAPTFSTLGDGLIIKVAGDFGTDYGFLSAPGW